MQRAFINILSNDVAKAAEFYESLLGMDRHFNSDWFVILSHPDVDGLEYGILQKDHEIVPDVARTHPGGTIMTFVVESCDDVYATAMKMGADIIEPPADMPYGQRRMLIKDPDGMVIDVSSPTAPLSSDRA